MPKNVYMQTLSEEEVQAILKFLKTPEGILINQKTLAAKCFFSIMSQLSFSKAWK